jgi:hypothetical protein
MHGVFELCLVPCGLASKASAKGQNLHSRIDDAGRSNPRVWWCGALDLIAQGSLESGALSEGNLISTLKLLNRVSVSEARS